MVSACCLLHNPRRISPASSPKEGWLDSIATAALSLLDLPGLLDEDVYAHSDKATGLHSLHDRNFAAYSSA